MKRTSLWLVLLALTPGICKAWGHNSYSCGVRYTPYAFTYRNSGLVSCDVDYTPYALTYRNSGLVPGYASSSGSGVSYGYPAGSVRLGRAIHGGSRGSRSTPRHAQDVPAPVRPQDGKDIIRGHLLAKGIESASINRILMIDNQLVSADFLLKDRNLLIKYWNPEAIDALNAQEGPRQKTYENYRANWAKVAAQHEQNGGRIYTVEASDAQTIVAALDACTTLEVEPQTESQTVLYAKD
jgi:hypothetical protein